MSRGKTWKAAALPALAAAALALAGCATRVRVEADRTPNMNTLGIQRVAIMPFEPGAGGSPMRASMASTLTAEATSRIRDTQAFELVSPIVISNARNRGVGIDVYADALFSGQVTGYTATTARIPGTTDADPGYIRVVEVRFSYQFVNTRDGTIIGPINRVGRAVSTQVPTRAATDRMGAFGGVARIAASVTTGRLTAYEALADRAIRNQLRLLYRDVAPHTVMVVRALEAEPDRELRPMMAEARALMRAGDHEAALLAYLGIWEHRGSIAAAINAAILYEALRGLEDAIHFLEHVYIETREPRVYEIIAQLNAEFAEQMGVEAFDDARTPAQRAAEHAIAETERVLPSGARLWIHGNAAVYQGLANEVIDAMVYAFLGAGVTVVERQMVDLILAEQNLHLDGSVSDSDFVSVGNMAGANAIVVVGVTGTGPARRLQLRVLDISQGTVLMQSGAGAAWRL